MVIVSHSCSSSDSMATAWSGGHSAPVLCVQAAGGGEGLLASGAERGEVAVWSQDGTPIARLRLPGDEDVTCTAFCPAAPGLLYTSHGEVVSVLDPRSLKEPVESLSGVGEEEINTLSFNDTGTMMATGDDSGAVRIVEVQSGKVVRTLRRHTNICSSVAFRPQRPQSLVSAGLDMQVLLWNLQKTRPVWAVGLQEEAGPVESEGRSQLFNPALAHCVGVSACGDVMACAAEDGQLHLMRVGAGSRLVHRGAIKAHSQGASQAHFLPFLSHPYWLVSGGNDGVVALWDLSAQGLPPQDESGHGSRRRTRGKGKARARHPQPTAPPAGAEGEVRDSGAREAVCEGSCEGVCEPSEPAAKTGPALRFTHTQKLNWVCPALLQGRPSILVADGSASVCVYALPAL